MHHTKLPAYLKEQKKYHLAHHYKNFELGFGVTSTFPLLIAYIPLQSIGGPISSYDYSVRQAKSGTTCSTPCSSSRIFIT